MEESCRAPFQTVCRALARRDYHSAELRQKLRQKEYDEQTIDTVLEEAERLQLLDDNRFLQGFLRMELERGHGWWYISSKLRGRGIDTAIDADTYDEILENALPEIVRRLERWAGGKEHLITDANSRRRVYGDILLKRGFRSGDISLILQECSP